MWTSLTLLVIEQLHWSRWGGVWCLGDIKGFAKGHLRGSNERKVSILCFSPIFSTEWVEYYNILEYTTFVSF